ncbi:methyltransferase [Celeribacter indicus]|uniref:Type 12 methyltransferase n=1 Tax=Celeribacter indicus TaxID=1208324 RepID=A0A0B5E7N3_9RHOB|nr:methyltransferase [Celeribacter indicus]AJE48302.1 type 12 methyltransferase [Celeribacter indicus]SDW72215.1 Predicted methyltransferase, contains TPR repeat [Celeribacter indicus]
MAGTLFSSGDLAVDRRASFAETLAHLGDLAGAIETLSGALSLAPSWAAGWFRLGEWLESAGDTAAACEAWDEAVRADPADALGAGLKRDLARRVPVVEAMPPAFVELLFDQYAPRFEHSLRDKLAYRGPEVLLDSLRRAGRTRFGSVLDLGCGTGLMGAAIRPFCDRLSGYDLSDGMLVEAERKGIYTLLEKRDISRLEVGAERYDLILAADVFNYLGALERVVAWCAGSLADEGVLAFTVEAGEVPVHLRESRRFAHSRAYVETLLADAGFAAVQVTPCVLREERGMPVEGFAVVAAGPIARLDREGDGDVMAHA